MVNRAVAAIEKFALHLIHCLAFAAEDIQLNLDTYDSMYRCLQTVANSHFLYCDL